MALTFYTSVVKRLKLQVSNFWDLILMFVGVTVEKLVGGFFAGGGGEGGKFIQNIHKGKI